MTALQAGTIDATEWVGPWNDLAFGFYKVVKNYHHLGFHEPGTHSINKAVWNGMSAGDQAIIAHAAMAENNYSLVEFSDEIFATIAEVAKDVLADVGNSDPETKNIYDSFMAFRKDVTGWVKLSDQGYMNKRNLVDFHS